MVCQFLPEGVRTWHNFHVEVSPDHILNKKNIHIVYIFKLRIRRRMLKHGMPSESNDAQHMCNMSMSTFYISIRASYILFLKKCE